MALAVGPLTVPYGTERPCNGLRLTQQLVKVEGSTVRIFLMAEAANCAKRTQTTPNGYYNLGRMVEGLVRHGATIGACGTCMDARGLTTEELVEGVHQSEMAELGHWTAEADEVIVFYLPPAIATYGPTASRASTPGEEDP
jgi:uncharacterized protein involved in oxidation of intracellular sulfur